MLKKYLLLVIILSYCLFNQLTSAYADSIYNHPLTNIDQPDFKQVQTQLSAATAITGNFTQRRDIKILSKPLLSSGHFSLSQAQGLVWRQTQPFASTLRVTANKIQQTILNNPPTVITRKEQPLVFTVSSVFLSVFQGDISQIQQYFNVYFTGNTEQWQIALKPKAAPLNKAIKSVELAGGRYISSIVLKEAQQNKMTINLTDVKPQSEPA